jgi:hypothetical protein
LRFKQKIPYLCTELYHFNKKESGGQKEKETNGHNPFPVADSFSEYKQTARATTSLQGQSYFYPLSCFTKSSDGTLIQSFSCKITGKMAF